eukprot:4992366-Pyramimonas_sp.AAC.2
MHGYAGWLQVGSTEVTLLGSPGHTTAHTTEVDTGTAGSCTLLVQVALPLMRHAVAFPLKHEVNC